MSRIKRVLGGRTTLALGAWVAHVLVFIPLYHLMGRTVTALAALPVIVMAWLFGMRVGLLASLLGFVLNILLMSLVGEAGWDVMVRRALPGSVLLVLIGAVVGRLRDLGEQVKRELTERKRAEEELRRHRDHLEELAGERTAELRKINEELHEEIAERKRAEEALKELVKQTEQAKEEWESTADSLPELICLIDDRGRIIRANRTVETWNLGRVVDVRGRGVHEILHPGCEGISCRLDSCWKQAWEEAMRGQPVECEVYDEVLKRHVLVRVQPWKGEAVGSTVVVVQDITEHKRAEEALKEYSERLEEMVEERTAAMKAINEQLRLEITERQQAEEALKRRMEYLAALSQASQAVTASLELDQVLAEIVLLAGQVVVSDYTTVVLMDEAGHIGQSAENLPGVTAIEYRVREEGLTSWIVRSRQAVVIGEIGEDGAISPDLGEGAPRFVNRPIVEAGIKSGAGLPLMVKGRLLGVLYLHSVRPHALDGQLPLLTTFANQVAIAIENARLYATAQQELAERKRAEEALRESEEKYRTILENIEDGYYEVDLAGNLTFFNDSLCRLYEYPEDELRGMNYRQYMDDETAKVAYRTFNGVYRTGNPAKAFDWEVIRKDGARRFVETSVTRITDAAGEPVGFRGIVRDITERKRAEEALRVSEERFALAVQGSNDGIWDWDIQNNSLYWSPRLKELLGYADDELDVDFDTLVLLLHPDDRGRTGAAIEAHLKDRGLYDVEQRLRTKSGEYRWFRARGQALWDEAGQPARMVGSTADITERKRAEEQLERYAVELEQANEEVKQFAYIVSHDLRAPLVNLKGFTTELRFALEAVDSAMETALPHLDEKQRQDVTLALQEDVPEALGFIVSSVTNMDHFISALLKLSRLGRRELHPEPVDMEALVQATLQILAHQIEERQVKVTVGPLPEMVADRTSMEQIVGNLLGNAVKYLDPDRPGEIEITAERGPDETTFHIRDNGRGIAEDDMDKVFAPFRRVGGQDVPGEGMGLPYVQALVRRHGGRLWCESKLGVGTTFTFTISNRLERGENYA